MDHTVARRLASDEGDEALSLAGAEADPDSLSAATRLRRHMDADLAAAALDQISLRRRAVDKIGPAGADMLWTRDGLEQATRGDVSRWRAQCLVSAGFTDVIDLGCACGADSRAYLDAGLRVTAVEIDSATAELARHNLPGARVLCANATEVVDNLLADAPDTTVVMMDPARRTGRGRTWRLKDVQPPWSFVEKVIGVAPSVVKLGPGVDRSQLPDKPVTYVGHRGDLVEATLWAGCGDRWQGDRAVLVSSERVLELPGALPDPQVGELCSFVAEPHPAAIRAGSLSAIDDSLCMVSDGIAYLTADTPVDSAWLTWFAVKDVLPLDVRTLRSWVRDHHVGTVEIKKRGVDVDPVTWRRKLKPSGPHAVTLICTPARDGANRHGANRDGAKRHGARAVVCDRIR
ncbi:SAM-dependent methyltransferase [Cutibacterium sp.]|uniref:THUMP-like domain-containing protein n=1 Tax=Cutibacterium sp. TaxID=1912221 RepID=UPI0026DC3657|nr:SAM-dependent methyltransferase [Cutibacterium sp.]MDO4413171.1 SAM-dependent methyltransferase [Cutibacterium sp.]